ncbi:MAG: hypothetical protein ABIJ45_06995 [Candidatus Zixiibacteriota bacterium]
MSKAFSYNRNLFGSYPSIFVFVLSAISIAAVFFVPKIMMRNWGFNSVYYISDIFYYVWILVGIGAIAILMITPREHFIAEYLKDYYWGGKKGIGRIGTLVLFLILFVIFRMETHYYGNGLLNVANLVQRSQPIMEWYNFGGVLIPYLLFLLLKVFGINELSAGLWSFQILSYLSGMIFLYYSFKVSELISEDYNERLGIFFMILLSGCTLFFFGTVEIVSLLLALMMLFFYYLLVFAKTGNRRFLIYLLIIFAIGLFINLQFITIIPALAYLTLKKIIKRRPIASYASNLTASILIVSAALIVYIKSMGDIFLENLILFFTGKPPEVNYGLFSGAHLADIFNLAYLFIPAFLILLLIIILTFKYLKSDMVYATLGYITIPQIIFLFIIDPKNGMARELGSYAFLLSGLLLWGIYAIYKGWEFLHLTKETVMALAPASLVVLFPMIYVHLAPEASFNYLDKYLSYDETKYESAIYAMRDYYNVVGDIDRSIQVEQSLNSKAPGALESQLVNDLYARDKVNESFEYVLRLTERNPYNANYRMQKANLLKYFGKISEAEKEYFTALKLDPYNAETQHFLSELYRETKQDAKCFMVLEDFLKKNPNNEILLVDLTGYYFRARKYDKIDSLTAILESINPDEPYIYMYRGLAAEGRRQKKEAMRLYEKFVTLGTRLPEITIIRKRINDIYLELKDAEKNQASPDSANGN